MAAKWKVNSCDRAVTQGGEKMLMIAGWSKQEARLVSALQDAVTQIQALEIRITALEG